MPLTIREDDGFQNERVLLDGWGKTLCRVYFHPDAEEGHMDKTMQLFAAADGNRLALEKLRMKARVMRDALAIAESFMSGFEDADDEDIMREADLAAVRAAIELHDLDKTPVVVTTADVRSCGEPIEERVS